MEDLTDDAVFPNNKGRATKKMFLLWIPANLGALERWDSITEWELNRLSKSYHSYFWEYGTELTAVKYGMLPKRLKKFFTKKGQ